MKKFFVFAICSLLSVSAIADYGTGFTAPAISGAPYAPQTGDIYLDADDWTFKGYDGDSWESLNAPNTAEMVKTPGTTSPRVAAVASFSVDSAGNIQADRGNFINGNCSLSSGTFTCTYETGYWNSGPICVGNAVASAGSKYFVHISASSASSISFQVYNDAGSSVSSSVLFICHGEK